MSDCATTFNNGCGCDNNSCNLIFLILILSCFGNNNTWNWNNNNSCDIILILLLLNCFGNNNSTFGFGCNNNNCGCGC